LEICRGGSRGKDQGETEERERKMCFHVDT
jgi:hypothetical protein